MVTKVQQGDLVTYEGSDVVWKVLCLAPQVNMATIISATSTNPCDAFMVNADILVPRPGAKLGREYPDVQLAQARRARVQSLNDQTVVFNACCCAWPVVKYHNRHGHDSGCPAAAIRMKQLEEGRVGR